jgi:hypothetical protein
MWVKDRAYSELSSPIANCAIGRRGVVSSGCQVRLVACLRSSLQYCSEKGPESRGRMSLFGVLRLRLSQETAPNSAQDDEFNYENNF